ncbi:sirohydrochlorin cobaltochelatase CbiKP [Desulfosarcina ovata subsp. sediminis]|uniref:Sirohydrochlorin cobaltochelatase CbiKP n=1 Tax=Desulfosarcina ovata subsp. sediminis TaxID=885957 RepID=A0A5K7ZH54_9BACT|nr:sirohydrochlorin cobaltochelatase [Desulfosarcina ovata]BBO80674.1 sirohydrochlorin cobaltochelatase CbiKP [Desulfosarcina ovata subsp. sediminis]
MNENTPIVMAAFGTTSRAMETYSFIDTAVKAAFPGHPVKWAYTSRMVRAHMKKRHRANMKNPQQVLDALAEQGNPWAVVQSLHLISGHEFYRLVDDVRQCGVRTSMGLPLLTSPEDYQRTATAILGGVAAGNGTATVLIGHGTDHPAWTAYPALGQILSSAGSNVHVATIEGEADMDTTVDAVLRCGAKRVHLVPLMLVAGVHLQEDIAGDEDSWRSAFEAAGIAVSVETQGLGKNAAIIDIFIRHIRDALAIVPESASLA